MVSARGRPLISPPHFAFFILSFISSAHGIAVERSKICHIPCHGSGEGFGFEEGHRYEYKYEGSSRMQVGGSSQDLAPLDLTATVSVEPVSSCSFHIHLSGVNLQGPNKKTLDRELIHNEANGILAGTDSTGRLINRLCALSDQSSTYTNLQRAVLSLLQTHIPKHAQPSLNSTLHQTDVFGVCGTAYSIKVEGDETKVLSTKDLDACAHREEARLPLITSPYHSKSGFDRTQVLEGKLKREQIFVNRVLKEALSNELYTLAPLSDQSAVSVIVSSKLTFVKKAKEVLEKVYNNYKEKSMIFEVTAEDNDLSTIDEIKSSLKILSQEQEPIIRETNPRQFHLFVKKIAGASKDDIMTIMKYIKEGKEFKNKMNTRRILLDGLVESESSASIEVMSELLKSGEISGIQAKIWFMNFPNTKIVTEKALEAAKGILDSEDVPVQAYLGIGTLAGKFCVQQKCRKVDVVNTIAKSMVKPLIGCKPSNFLAENKMIAGLKGLGNMRMLNKETVEVLTNCLKDKQTLVRLRVAILETMKMNSNYKQIKEIATRILTDVNEDAELRIKSYLTLVENPSEEVAGIISELLMNRETSNQVGGFIVSHLRNIRSSTNPDKEAARHHLGGIYTRSGKYKWDPKKYSQNFEISYNGDKWGAAGEANIIYSYDSYLPRSTSFNLTTILCGHSFNLFEVGIRTENVEKIYEYILRSLTLKRDNINALVKNGTNAVDDISNRFSQTFRPKRSVEVDKINQFYNEKVVKPNVYHDDFLLDFSIKSLGAEVGFLSYLGDEIGPQRSMDEFFDTLKYTVDKAKNLNVEYSKHTTFLEGEVIYPTGLGLPLRVKTRGSAAFGMSAEAKMDIPSALKNLAESFQMKLKLIPSGSVEVIGSITMDAGSLESGVEVSLTAHSSTGGDVSLKMNKGKEVEFVMGVPLREQKIISASTGLNAISRFNDEVTTLPIDLDINKVSIEDYTGCFEQLSPLTGLTFCGEISMPNNNLPTINPFYGSSKLAFSIHVEDESISSYLIKASYDHIKEKGRKKFSLLLDTPESKINRKILIGYESEQNPGMKQFKFMLDSFWKSISVHGSLLETDKEVAVKGRLKYDEEEFSTKAGLTITKSSPSVTVFTPFFHYSLPHQHSRLIGRTNPSSPAIKISGEILVEKKQSEGITTYLFNRLTMETQRTNFTLDGSLSSQIKGDSSSITSDLKLIYDEEYVSINGTISRPDSTRLEGNISVYPSQNPDLAFTTQGRLENVINQDFKFLSEFEFTHGPNPDNKEMRFTWNNHVLISGIRDNNMKYIAIRHYIGYPPSNLRIESDLEWLPRNLKYNLGVKLDQSKADLKLTASTDPSGPYDIFIGAMFMNQGFKLNAKREIIDNYKSKFTNSLELTPSKLYQVNALVNHKFIWSDLDIGIQSEIKTPFQPKHIRLSTGAQNNEEKSLGQFFLEADAKVFIDFFFERIKGPKSKGNFKLITDYIDSKADFGFQDSVLKGSGYLIFVQSQNEVNGAVDMIIKYPKYAGTVSITWKESPSKSKTIILTTETNLEAENFHTKNILLYEGKENHFNVFTTKSGNNRKGSFDLGVELKLADADELTGKFSRNLDIKPGDSGGLYSLEVSHKTSPQAKETLLSFSLSGEHNDFDQGVLNGQLLISYKSPLSRELMIKLTHHKMPVEDKWTVDCGLDVSGSLISSPLKLKVESELSRGIFADSMLWSRVLPASSYRIQASFGTDTSLEFFGKITDHILSGELSFQLPEGYKVRTFKGTTSNLVQLNPGPDNKCQVKTSNVIKWNDNFFEIDSEFSLEKGGGSAKFDWATDKTKKRSLHVSSHWPEFSEYMSGGSYNFDLSFKYDKDGKPSDAFYKYNYNHDKKESSYHFHGTCPANGVYDLKVVSKSLDKGNTDLTEWVWVANNKTRRGLCKVSFDLKRPYLEFYMEDETRAKSGFLIKAENKGISEWTGNVHVEWHVEPGKRGFFYVNSEMKLISLDNFFIKVEANSNKYQLKNWQLEVNSDKSASHSTGSKIIVFKMQHDTKTLLNGSATYDLSYTSEGVYKIEAHGDALFDGSLQPLSIKAVWKPIGERKMLNGTLVHGENKMYVESVIAESEIYYVRKYCSPGLNGKCSEARLIWNSNSPDQYTNEKKLEVVLDVSSMNPAYNDIILKVNLKKSENTLDQKIEFQWVKDRIFLYKAYVYEEKAGVTIGLPQRTISGDIAYQIPKDIYQGRLFIEGNLWLNKIKEPTKKTHLLLLGEIARDKELYSLYSEAKLSHPSLPKDFAMKGKATMGKSLSKPKSDGHFEFDVFKQMDDAIILTWSMGNNDEKGSFSSHKYIIAKSKGLKLDMGYERRVTVSKTSMSYIDSVHYLDQTGTKKESFIKADVKPKKILLSFMLPDAPMYDVNISFEKKDRKINLLGNYIFAGAKYQENIEIINYNNINYQFQFGKGRTLNVDIGLALGQMAEFKASLNKNPIYQLEIALNEADFLKTKHNYNKENFKKFCEAIGDEMAIISNSFDKEIKKAVDREGKALNILINRIGNAIQDPSPLFASYRQDLGAMLDEISDDEVLKQTLAPLRDILSSTIEQIVELMEELIELITEVRTVVEQAIKYSESIIASISEKIKETSHSISTALSAIIESTLDAYLSVVDQIFIEFNKHHKEIQAAATVISEFSQDMGRLVVKIFKQVKNDFDDFIRLSWEELKQMPLFQILEEKLKQLKSYKVSEGYWPDIQEILRTVAESAPNPELKRLITTLTDYIDQYIKEDNLDLDAALYQIYTELIASIKPTIDSIYEALTNDDNIFNSKILVPIPWLSLWKAGGTSGGIRLSSIKWIVSGDLPTVIDYAIHSWSSMCHLLPPYKAISFISGSEIVTYDGEEVSLNDGTYILAQELNNKFSIVAEVKDGFIISIQLAQGSEVARSTSDGKLWINGDEVGHTTKAKDGKLGVRYTLSGGNLENEEVYVVCQWKLKACRVVLKAPAFAKVRGILGTYNYEVFDDFTLPNGKITSKNDFINSWKLDGNNEEANNKESNQDRQSKCTHMFTSSDQFTLCYRLIDPKPFREMCDNLVGKAKTPEEKKKGLCYSVYHYTRSCRNNNLKIDIPSPCNVCEVEGKEVTLDELKVVRTPEKKADIVFLVELKSSNSKLYDTIIKPLAKQLEKKLNSMGNIDVEYGLIGYGSKELSYVNYFKKDGNLQMKSSLPAQLPWAQLSENIEEPNLNVNATIMDKLWDAVDKFFIADDQTERGMVRGSTSKSYPWRPGSYRSIVSLVSSPCPQPEPFLSPLTRIKMAQRLMTMKSYGIVYNLITPVNDLSLSSGKSKDILGFSKDETFLINDVESGVAAKERKQGLTYSADACHLFPVETGGNIFISENLEGNAAVEAVTTRVANSLISQNKTFHCRCIINRGLHPKYECTES